MKHIFSPLFFLLLSPGFINAQAVSINEDGSLPVPSAILDVKSTSKGVLIPRMTSAQRTAIASPATGLLVYDTNTNTFWYYGGTAWLNLASARLLADADGDTKVQVEESVDEDKVRVDLAGSERLVLRRNTNGGTLLEFPNNLNNIFLGNNAGNNNLNGEENIGIGENALGSNTTGEVNTAIGNGALSKNTIGEGNIAIGHGGLFNNQNGSENIAIGSSALYFNNSTSMSTAIGNEAMLSTGSYSPGISTFSTAIGYRALRNRLKTPRGQKKYP